MKKTALIILNYNNPADTLNCLKSVRDHNSAPIKMVVVDNGSAPEKRRELIQAITSLYGADGFATLGRDSIGTVDTLADVTLLLLDENTGYARGNNAGIELTYRDDEIDRIMVLNNDILFVEDIIPALIALHDSTPDCAIISPLLYKKDLEGIDYNCARRNVTTSQLIRNNLFHYFRRLRGKTDDDANARQYILRSGLQPRAKMLPIELPSGSCMLIKKDFFKEIGAFDSGTFLYFEENILYKKIAATAKRNYLAMDLRCIHLGASTTCSMSKFAVMKAIESERYYVKNFSGASMMARAIHALSSRFYKATFLLQKSLSRK